MRRRWTVAVFLATCMALPLSSPTWGYTKVKFKVVRPPAVVLQDVETLAVLPFYVDGEIDWAKYQEGSFGDWLIGELFAEPLGEAFLESGLGEGFAMEVRQRLVENQMETHEVYRVTPSDATRMAIKDRGLDPSEAIGESDAAAIGSMLGAEAVLWGRIKYSGATRTWGDDSEEECRNVEARSAAHLKIIDPRDNRVLATRRLVEDVWDRKCGANLGKLPSVAEMVKRSLDQILTSIPRKLSPHIKQYSLELQKVSDPAYKARAADGVEAVRTTDYDEAIAVFEALVSENDEDPRLHYNLGVVYEVQGRLGPAEQSYRRAKSLKRRDKYRDGVKRVKTRRGEIEKLAEMGITVDR